VSPALKTVYTHTEHVVCLDVHVHNNTHMCVCVCVCGWVGGCGCVYAHTVLDCRFGAAIMFMHEIIICVREYIYIYMYIYIYIHITHT
jgi:hypothetical protein